MSMYLTFPWIHGEGFGLLLEDLQSARPGMVEGFRLIPHLVRPHLVDARDAIWLLPTPELRRAAFAGRTGDDAFWQRTSDPQRALENVLARDAIFTDEVARDAGLCGLATIVVDGVRSIADLADELAERLRLTA